MEKRTKIELKVAECRSLLQQLNHSLFEVASLGVKARWSYDYEVRLVQDQHPVIQVDIAFSLEKRL